MDYIEDHTALRYYLEILNRYGLKEGSSIDYDTLDSIMIDYSHLKPNVIFYIFGINEYALSYTKYQGKKTIVTNGVVREKINYIKPLFKEARFYSLEEITTVLMKYGISLRDFIIHIINNRLFYKTDFYESIMYKSGGLFIGKAKMSDDFFQMHYDEFLRRASRLLKKIPRKNRKEEANDYIQDILIYIYENCRDLEVNFGASEDSFNKMFQRASKRIWGLVCDGIRNSLEAYPIEKEGFNSEKNPLLIDKNSDTENDALFLYEQSADENIYTKAISLFEYGYTLEECILVLQTIYNIKAKEVLVQLKEYALSNQEENKIDYKHQEKVSDKVNSKKRKVT